MSLRHEQRNHSRPSERDKTNSAILKATEALKYHLNFIEVHLETVSVLHRREQSQLCQDLSLIQYVDKIGVPLREQGKNLSKLDQNLPPWIERSAAAQLVVKEYKEIIGQMGYEVSLCKFKERKDDNDTTTEERKDTSLFICLDGGKLTCTANEPAVIIKDYGDDGEDASEELLRHYWARKPVSGSGRICCNCCVMETRQWIRMESTLQWLCHRCGQFWRKHKKHRTELLWDRPRFKRRSRKREAIPQRNQDVGHWSPGPAHERQADAAFHFSPTLQNASASTTGPMENPRNAHGNMLHVGEHVGPLTPIKSLLETLPRSSLGAPHRTDALN